MALDGLFLNCIKQDLASSLMGAKVDKIYQPSGEELVLLLRQRNLGGVRLLLSARANSPRINVTDATYENPAKPPMLCMLLRKRLGGATLTDIRQAGLDRILFLDFQATNELGDREQLTLVIEIMAQYSNIILVGPDGKIIDALKRVDLTKSSKRLVLPGLPYELPPAQEKANLVEDSIAVLLEKIRSYQNKTVSGAVLSAIMGISPIVAREVASRALGEDKYLSELSVVEFSQLETALLELREYVLNKEKTYCLVKDEGGKPIDFSFLPLSQYGPNIERETFDSPSALLEAYYAKRDSMERIASKTADLNKFLHNTRNRLVRKMDHQKQELAQTADREKLRISAELINANLYRLEKGASFFDLENYYENNAILRVPVNPALSPAQNSQKYYKDYRKTYTAEKKLKEQIQNGAEELLYLDSVLDALSRVETERDIAQIRQELTSGGYLKKRPLPNNKSGKKQKQGKQPASLPPKEYETSDGYRVLVGRNNLQNDKLSLKTAGKLDLWLHTKDFPGSHVILENKDGDFSDQAIEEAACIAAVNSTAVEADKVPVNYTLVKNLKKPTGAKPGKVIYHEYYTLYITPDPELTEKLRKN